MQIICTYPTIIYGCQFMCRSLENQLQYKAMYCLWFWIFILKPHGEGETSNDVLKVMIKYKSKKKKWKRKEFKRKKFC